jgi:hypothetical protein
VTKPKTAKRKKNPSLSMLPVGKAIAGVLHIVRRKNGRKVVTFRAKSK